MNLGALTRRLDKIAMEVRERENATGLAVLYTLAMIGVPVRADTRFSRGQRTVLGWRTLRLSAEMWHRQAEPAQMKLMADTREEFAPAAAPVLGPDDVTHRYKTSIPSPVDTTPLEQRVRTAQENYVLALKRQCSATSYR